ncbi:hypothetical protein [Neisseria dentiae]|uniref:hypothetical protein n=1 Tax=Neisseria dentiae TaxID=194197 RepID=UPI0035A07803
MLNKYLLSILFVLFTNLNTAWAATPRSASCHQKLIGSYGIQAMPRSATLLAQLATAGISADEAASYDGFPFLVTHYYLRPEFEHHLHLPRSQRPKASLPKQQILFRVLRSNTSDTWLLQDSSPQDFVSLNATDGRDLSQVKPSPAQLNTLSLSPSIRAHGCYLKYGEDTYEPRYLIYFNAAELNPAALAELTQLINHRNHTSFSPDQIRLKRYFLLGSLSTSALGGEQPFGRLTFILPIDKLE